MKKLVVVLAVSLFSISSGFAGGNPGLAQEIEEKVIINLDGVELDQFSEDYVIVNFKIVNDEISINEIEGTSPELKNKVIEELYAIHVDSDYKEGETYLFRFTFDQK